MRGATVQRILVPLDLSPLGEAKLPIAEAQARAFGAELYLLHVLPVNAIDPSGAVSTHEAHARTYLDNVASRQRADGLTTNAFIRSGPVASTILDAAREREIDLIVLGSNPRVGLPRAFLGSVADEVVRQAECAVLLVRPNLTLVADAPIRSFDNDAARMGPLSQRTVGLRPVELSRIIGSVGRAHTLGTDFRPIRRTREDDQRYGRVYAAMESAQSLPPIELYKLGFGYYVLDGNHRVAAAHALGYDEIDSEVTEFIALGDTEGQRLFAERRAFERTTGLMRVEASLSSSYGRLLELVYDDCARRPDTDTRECARLWYQSIFRPAARHMRQHTMAEHFPGERSADIFLRVADFRKQVIGETGLAVDWPAAIDMFAESIGARQPRRGTILPLLGRGDSHT